MERQLKYIYAHWKELGWKQYCLLICYRFISYQITQIFGWWMKDSFINREHTLFLLSVRCSAAKCSGFGCETDILIRKRQEAKKKERKKLVKTKTFRSFFCSIILKRHRVPQANYSSGFFVVRQHDIIFDNMRTPGILFCHACNIVKKKNERTNVSPVLFCETNNPIYRKEGFKWVNSM